MSISKLLVWLLLASVWGLDCSDLLIRMTKMIPVISDDNYRLTVITRGQVEITSPDVKLSVPRPIQLDPDLTQDHTIFDEWYLFKYQHAILEIESGGSREVRLRATKIECSYKFYAQAHGTGDIDVIFGDPYFGQSSPNPQYAKHIRTRLPQMLNMLFILPEFNSVGILGDMWYEYSPKVAVDFFKSLEPQVRAAHLYTTPGNHDIWLWGSYPAHHKQELYRSQFGLGFTQFWGQDTIGTAENPPAHIYRGIGVAWKDYHDRHVQVRMAGVAPRWGQSYFKRGNKGYIIFNGFWPWNTQRDFFEEACNALEDPDVRVILVLSHWSEDSYSNDMKHACGAALSCRNAWDYLRNGTLGESSPCYRAAQVGQLKYFMGHDHFNECNEMVTVTNYKGERMETCAGFNVGGTGKSGGSFDGTRPASEETYDCDQCTDSWTIPLLDTRNDELAVSFLHVVDNLTDLFDTWMTCLKNLIQDKGSFNLNYILNSVHCASSNTMVHTWRQPLGKIFKDTSKGCKIPKK